MRRIHTRRREGLAGHLDILINDACVRFSYCARFSGAELLRAHETLTDDLVAGAVLESEGLNPEVEKNALKRLKQLFRERFGQTV